MDLVSTTDVYKAALEQAHGLIGRTVTTEQTGTRCFNEEATGDTIYHYAVGTADYNPLWLDLSYARRSRFGTIIAPPTFLYSVHLPSMGNWLVGLPGDEPWALIFGGCSWDFHRPIQLGDRMHVSAMLKDAEIKESRTFGQMIVLTSQVDYRDANNQLVARAVSPQLRYLARQGDANRTSQLQGRTSPTAGASTELDPQEAGDRAVETRRGASPRYWDEVNEGETLPDFELGQLGVGDIIRWTSGTHSGRPRSSRGRIKYTGYHDPAAASAEGVPGAFDNGPLRSAWLSQLVTNWIGDWGDLVHLEYTLRGFNVVGDVNTAKGRVIAKRSVNGKDLVDLELAIENDRAQKTALGKAVVALPRIGG
jgi:acyl dehydratase